MLLSGATASPKYADQHPLEMLPRQRILALEEEGAGELQAHPHPAFFTLDW